MIVRLLKTVAAVKHDVLVVQRRDDGGARLLGGGEGCSLSAFDRSQQTEMYDKKHPAGAEALIPHRRDDERRATSDPLLSFPFLS